MRHRGGKLAGCTGNTMFSKNVLQIKGWSTDQFFAWAGLHVIGIGIGILQRVATLERPV